MSASAARNPVGFLSYVHADDEADDGRLTEFRVRLEREIRVQTAAVFTIFQDRQDIRWGDAWQQRIELSIDNAAFLIPIITPSFFLSEQCRTEFDRFVLRERQLGRSDLIFPVYYVNCHALEDGKLDDEIAQVISKRQFTDWRDLRFDSFSSSKVARRIAELAQQLGAALARQAPLPTAASKRTEGSSSRAAGPASALPAGLASFANLSKDIGLVKIYHGFDQSQADILTELRGSRHIKIFAQMGKSVLSGKAAIIYQALEHTRTDAEIKILHAGAENPYLSERVALSRDSNYGEWREDIGYVVSIGTRLQGRLGPRLELRRHSEGYVWRFFLFDNHVYLQPYLFPRDNASKAPVLKFARSASENATLDNSNPSSLYHMLVTYFDLKWEEYAPDPTRLDDMITAGDPTSVAALVERAGVWVFVVPKRFMERSGEELPFHSIGGKRHDNEDWVEALQREATEEIGVRLDVKSSSRTRDLTTSSEWEPLALSNSPRPYCVYKKTREVDPEVVEPEVLWIVGFEAELSADVELEPRREIAAVIYLSRDMLRRTARERITYDQIRRAGDGSGVILQAGVDFNFERIAVPTGLAALPTFSTQRARR